MTAASPSDDAFEALRHELRAEPPAGFAALDPAALAELTRMLRDARHAELAAMEAAADKGLAFIPRLLRGAVKKVLFG